MYTGNAFCVLCAFGIADSDNVNHPYRSSNIILGYYLKLCRVIIWHNIHKNESDSVNWAVKIYTQNFKAFRMNWDELKINLGQCYASILFQRLSYLAIYF